LRPARISAAVAPIANPPNAQQFRNLKPQRRAGLTLISLAWELDRTLSRCRAPWHRQLARGP